MSTWQTRNEVLRSYIVPECDILTQDLIGLKEYSYHQTIHSFLQVQL
jgi:hypothetical protein